MAEPSNPGPLYPAFGWVANLLVRNPISLSGLRMLFPLLFLWVFNLCVLPRPPPRPMNLRRLPKCHTRRKSFLDAPPGG